MTETDVRHIHDDLMALKQDIALIKNILAEEYELSDWAKAELERERRVPAKELVCLADAKKLLLK